MVFEFFVPGLPRMMADTGAEFAIYDMEHGGVSIETLRTLVAASRGPSPLPFARVPATEYHLIAGALDAGMLGLMMRWSSTLNKLAASSNPRTIRRSAVAAQDSAWLRTTTSAVVQSTRSRR